MTDLINPKQDRICLDCAVEFGNYHANSFLLKKGKCDWCDERTDVADANLFFSQPQSKIKNESQF